jgi:hypothetical protein
MKNNFSHISMAWVSSSSKTIFQQYGAQMDAENESMDVLNGHFTTEFYLISCSF